MGGWGGRLSLCLYPVVRLARPAFQALLQPVADAAREELVHQQLRVSQLLRADQRLQTLQVRLTRLPQRRHRQLRETLLLKMGTLRNRCRQ